MSNDVKGTAGRLAIGVGVSVLTWNPGPGLVALAGETFSQVVDAVGDWRVEQRDASMHQLASELNRVHSAEDVIRLLHDAGEHSPDMLFDFFLQQMLCIDEAAKPCIARLAAWYLSTGRSRDRIFRDIGSLLTDRTASELEALEQILGPAIDVLASYPGAISITVENRSTGAALVTSHDGAQVSFFPFGADRREINPTVTDCPPAWREALASLKAHSFAGDMIGGNVSSA